MNDTIKQLIKNMIRPCAVLIDNTPIHHLDNKSIDKSMGYPIRKVLNHEMTSILSTAFPSFMLRGLLDVANPLSKQSKLEINRNPIKCVNQTIDDMNLF